jgi:hypothetical protein
LAIIFDGLLRIPSEEIGGKSTGTGKGKCKAEGKAVPVL